MSEHDPATCACCQQILAILHRTADQLDPVTMDTTEMVDLMLETVSEIEAIIEEDA